MQFKAQIVQLDNLHEPDQEVILYCDHFYELKRLLADPKAYMSAMGLLHFNDKAWDLLSPVTAMIRSEQDDAIIKSRFTEELEVDLLDIRFNLAPKISDVFGTETKSNDSSPSDSEIEPEAETLESTGGFVAQFAKKTHTLYVTYKLPTTLKTAAPVRFTLPHAISTKIGAGTLHFDIEDKTRPSEVVRAGFIVDHIADADANTWNKLERRPVELLIPAPILPDLDDEVRDLPPSHLKPAEKDVYFKQMRIKVTENGRTTEKIVSPLLVVEGLSIESSDSTAGPVVCLQAGAVRVPDDSPQGYHWELNGVIVKNYTA